MVMNLYSSYDGTNKLCLHEPEVHVVNVNNDRCASV